MITDNDIEQFARGMCVELGLDPDEPVGLLQSDTQTDYESRYRPVKLHTIHHPGVAPPYYVAHGEDPVFTYARWQMFRRDAARALAAHKTYHTWLLLADKHTQDGDDALIRAT